MQNNVKNKIERSSSGVSVSVFSTSRVSPSKRSHGTYNFVLALKVGFIDAVTNFSTQLLTMGKGFGFATFQ